MKNQKETQQIKSLTDLLITKFPSSLTRRIELDSNFIKQAKKWPDQTLDFSFYEDLEYIEVKGGGEIRKIKVSQNKKLQSLIIPSQELAGTLDLSSNSEIVELNIANNLLNTVKVHGNFSQKLKGLRKNNLSPQKHNPNKIHPVRDATVVLLDMSEAEKVKSSTSNHQKSPEPEQVSDNSTKTTTSEEKSAPDLAAERNYQISQLENRLKLLEISRNEMVNSREEQIEELEQQLAKKENKIQELKAALVEEQKVSTTKQAEVDWLKKQLKQIIGEEEYQAKVEVNYPTRFK